MSLAGRMRRRKTEIKLKQKRHEKISYLKERYEASAGEADRRQILDKLWKIAPDYPVEPFKKSHG